MIPETRLETDFERIDLRRLHEIDLIGAAIGQAVEGSGAVASAVASVEKNVVGGLPVDDRASRDTAGRPAVFKAAGERKTKALERRNADVPRLVPYGLKEIGRQTASMLELRHGEKIGITSSRERVWQTVKRPGG